MPDALIQVVNGKNLTIGSFELPNPSAQFATIQQSEMISDLIGDVKVEDTGGPDSGHSKAAPPLFSYQHNFGPLPIDGPQVLGQGEPKWQKDKDKGKAKLHAKRDKRKEKEVGHCVTVAFFGCLST
ncbi:hypothetical protein E3N88_43854 [Mikania micrantha]|uniref:Uncharacterized protein n=1 Tax=Mikania micrantha TaxID=192012 RepID=A0A5N6LDX7_9ASTR|nr:hypothetical protein E3N88_43854 [Mikania micrantha]